MNPGSTAWIKLQWANRRPDKELLISMARNALPPTAALWMINSSSLGKAFDTVGYLPIIVCILQQPIQPRVQFMKGMLVTCIMNCVTACVCLLAGYCSNQARLHTTQPGSSFADYNSSAAAVVGVWIVFTVWIIQTFRVYRPQYTTSCSTSTIMTIVCMTSFAELHTQTEITNLVTSMLEMFFLAHSFCTATNLLIFPTTSRDLVFADLKRYVKLVEKILSLESACVESLAQERLVAGDGQNESQDDLGGKAHKWPQTRLADDYQSLKESIAALSALHGKLRLDVSFAKHDFGWSTISAVDLDIIVNYCRKLIMSLRGMSALMPLIQDYTEVTIGRHSTHLSGDEDINDTEDYLKKYDEERLGWNAIFSDLKQPNDDVHVLMQEGLRHFSSVLDLNQPTSLRARLLCGWRPRRSAKTDVESNAQRANSAEDFLRHYESRVQDLHQRRGTVLRQWLQRTQSSSGETKKMEEKEQVGTRNELLHRSQDQLFLILYMQHLFHHASDVVLELVKFIESRNPRLPGHKKRLVTPVSQSLKNVVQAFTKEDDTHDDDDYGISQSTVGNVELWAGSSHLHSSPHPIISGFLRAYRIIGSPQSFFGFRVACAVISVLIVALLEPSQQWFFNQRCLWAAVFIPFSMSPNSGETLSLLGFRLVGSAWAIPFSLLNWYIVDGHPAGIIVFYFFFTMFEEYFLISLPQYGSIWRPALITRAIITGYSFQYEQSRVPAPPATVNHAYPVYLIGPYRYVCTVVGVTVAFIWTVFPHATTARSLARKKLGQSLSLLALFYNCVHSTIGLWATGRQGNPEDPSSPGQRVKSVRDKLFAQQLMILSAIKQHLHFSRFEPSMGNQFHKDLYQKIIKDIDATTSHMNMMVYAAGTLHLGHDQNEPGSEWQAHIAQAWETADFSTNNISAILSVLYIAVTNDQPLPPGLASPKSYQLAREIRKLHPDALTAAHAQDPGYAALAVIEIGAKMMSQSMGRLLDSVKELVGAVEFYPIEHQKAGKQA